MNVACFEGNYSRFRKSMKKTQYDKIFKSSLCVISLFPLEIVSSRLGGTVNPSVQERELA